MNEFVVCINSNTILLSEEVLKKIINICKNKQVIITSNFDRLDNQLKPYLQVGKFIDYYGSNNYLYDKIDAFIFIKKDIKPFRENDFYIAAKELNKQIRIIIQE